MEGKYFQRYQRASEGIDRSTSDYMGMLATVMNALSFQSCLEKIKVPTRVQSAITMAQVAEPYIKEKLLDILKKTNSYFAAGTGNPFSQQIQLHLEDLLRMNCSLIVKATKVDGIYNKDPKFKDAKLLKKITYNEVINNNLRVMDLTAISLG